MEDFHSLCRELYPLPVHQVNRGEANLSNYLFQSHKIQLPTVNQQVDNGVIAEIYLSTTASH